MLFIGHSAATAVNAGKVYFTKNPMAINYPQWVAFAKYSYKQLKCGCCWRNQNLEMHTFRGIIAEELNEVYAEIDKSFAEMSEEYIVVFN